ncbi:hypothetical protein GCM10009780_19240 [Actinomadura alba]
MTWSRTCSSGGVPVIDGIPQVKRHERAGTLAQPVEIVVGRTPDTQPPLTPQRRDHQGETETTRETETEPQALRAALARVPPSTCPALCGERKGSCDRTAVDGFDAQARGVVDEAGAVGAVAHTLVIDGCAPAKPTARVDMDSRLGRAMEATAAIVSCCPMSP